MWRSIEIRNFRSLELVKATLGPFTIVVGPNSSGKSNFIDAFVFARDVAADASSALQNRGGIASIRRWRPSRPVDVSIDLRVAHTREALAHTYARHSFTLASTKSGTWKFKEEIVEVVAKGIQRFALVREHDRITELASDRRLGPSARESTLEPETMSAVPIARRYRIGPNFGALHDIRRFRLQPDEIRRSQVVTERTDLDESGANLAAAIGHLRAHEPDKWQAVQAAMRKIIPGLTAIEEVTLGRYMGLRFFQQRTRGELAEFTATEMSEGAVRALAILVAAQQVKPYALTIMEEPEVAIHPGAANVLFESLKAASRSGSVLLTTHSPELLDAASTEEILVCDYRKGVTSVGPLDDRQRKLVRDGLFSVSELMRSEPLRIQGMRPEVIEEA